MYFNKEYPNAKYPKRIKKKSIYYKIKIINKCLCKKPELKIKIKNNTLHSYCANCKKKLAIVKKMNDTKIHNFEINEILNLIERRNQ